MNPYMILGVVLLVVAAGVAGERHGFTRGINEQKVADQAKFDQINIDLAAQQAEAEEQLKLANAENTRIRIERDKLKTQLGEVHEKSIANATAERTRLATEQLRFGTAKDNSCGQGGDGSEAGKSGSALPSGASVVQLPDQITRDLRQLTFDADKLKADYVLCRGFAQQVE